jgi:hypothetical protein
MHDIYQLFPNTGRLKNVIYVNEIVFVNSLYRVTKQMQLCVSIHQSSSFIYKTTPNNCLVNLILIHIGQL